MKNNANISSALKDISKMFQSQMTENIKNRNSDKVILDTIRSNSKSTDENNALLKQSISLQNDMMDQLKQISSSVSGLMQQLSDTEDGKKTSPLDKALESSSSLAMMAGLLAAGSAFLNPPDFGGETETTVGGDSNSFGGGSGGSVVNTDLPQEAQAFLNTLTAPGFEGTANYQNSGYNTIVGGGQFEGYESHPNIVGVVTSAGPSTAAGRYQITSTTWKELSKKYNLTDFSPENQDLAAWLLAQERYTQITKRNLLEDLKSNDPKVLNGIEQALSGTWSSLKGGVHQGSSAGSFSNFYSQNLQTLNTPNQQDVPSENEVIPTSTSSGDSSVVMPENSAMDSGANSSGAAPLDGVTGNTVSVQPASHEATGSGYTVEGAVDSQGRPVVFGSENAARAFGKMMADSGGKVKGSDVTSSQRSEEQNKSVGGVSGSKHLTGNALDIHGPSGKWIRENGSKYGWKPNDYPGSHGGHFEFSGNIQPLSDNDGPKADPAGSADTGSNLAGSGDTGSNSGAAGDQTQSDILSNFGGISADNISSNLGQLDIDEQIESITASVNSLLPANPIDIISEMQGALIPAIANLLGNKQNLLPTSENVEAVLQTSPYNDQKNPRPNWRPGRSLFPERKSLLDNRFV